MDKAIWKLIALLILAIPVNSVLADGGIPYARHTVTVPIFLEDIATSVLLNNPVEGAEYYAITDITTHGDVYVVSIVAIRGCDPQTWNLDCAIKLFTIATDGVISGIEGSPEYTTLTNTFMNDYEQYKPNALNDGTAGGDDGDYSNSNLPVLPFKAGTKVVIGSRGVHDAGFSLTGWKAIDLVSGSDIGSGAAPNEVYASIDSEITYVCRDDHSVAVRAGNFLYAHLEDNANLTVGYNLRRGVKFASMVVGSFTDTCGWASQQPNHYHLHFGVPGVTAVQFAGWTFRPFEGGFVNGNTWVRTGDYLYNPGLTAGDNQVGDPAEQIKQGNSFWDGIVSAMINVIRDGILKRFPERSATNYQDVYINASSVVLRVFFIMLSTSFDLTFFAFFMTAMFILEPARVIYKLYMSIKKAIPFV